MTAIELQPEQFHEGLKPIFDSVESQMTGKTASGALKTSHFFPVWQIMMRREVARTWQIEGGLLGAIFVPHLFTGELEATVIFWFTTPAARKFGGSLRLLEAVKTAARLAGCVRLKSSAYNLSNPELTGRMYRTQGFAEIERGYSLEIANSTSFLSLLPEKFKPLP